MYLSYSSLTLPSLTSESCVLTSPSTPRLEFLRRRWRFGRQFVTILKGLKPKAKSRPQVSGSWTPCREERWATMSLFLVQLFQLFSQKSWLHFVRNKQHLYLRWVAEGLYTRNQTIQSVLHCHNIKSPTFFNVSALCWKTKSKGQTRGGKSWINKSIDTFIKYA